MGPVATGGKDLTCATGKGSAQTAIYAVASGRAVSVCFCLLCVHLFEQIEKFIGNWLLEHAVVKAFELESDGFLSCPNGKWLFNLDFLAFGQFGTCRNPALVATPGADKAPGSLIQSAAQELTAPGRQPGAVLELEPTLRARV